MRLKHCDRSSHRSSRLDGTHGHGIAHGARRGDAPGWMMFYAMLLNSSDLAVTMIAVCAQTPALYIHFDLNLIHTAPMKHLPPFVSLVAFDAVVRHKSITRAAAELGLTQSAISHRVRRLEAFMSAPLLHRHNTGLQPTSAGEALVEGLTKLLDDAAALRAQCHMAIAPNRLRVGIGAALAENWLVRRLPDFAESCPHISVELVVVELKPSLPRAFSAIACAARLIAC
jgi:hypothetical protein